MWLVSGRSSDGHQLAEMILSQALSAAAPNMMVLGYLKHCAAADTVSHASVIKTQREREENRVERFLSLRF